MDQEQSVHSVPHEHGSLQQPHDENHHNAGGEQHAHEKKSLPGPVELLKSAWEIYKKHFKSLLWLSAIPGLLFIGIAIVSFAAGAVIDEAVGVVLFILGIPFGIYLGIRSQIAGMHLVAEDVANASAKTYWDKAKGSIWGYFVVALLAGIATCLGFILLIIPGIIVGVFLSLSTYANVFEGLKGVEALKRSKFYVTGIWFDVFVRAVFIGIVIWIPFVILFAIIGIFIRDKEVLDALSQLVSFLITPLILAYGYKVYESVKRMKA